MGSFHDQSSRLFFTMAGIALTIIVLLYLFEVTARYGFNAPTTWSSEVIQYCLSVVIFLALPEVTRRSSHVAIDILPSLTRGWVLATFNRLGYTIGGLVCLTAGSIAGWEAFRQFERGLMTNAAHPIPRWWITAIVAIGLLSAGIHFFRHWFVRSPKQNPMQ